MGTKNNPGSYDCYANADDGNQISPITPGLQPALSHSNHPTAIGRHGGSRAGAGRPKGVPNKTKSTDTPPPAAAAE